jgi:hypothetical protein
MTTDEIMDQIEEARLALPQPWPERMLDLLAAVNNLVRKNESLESELTAAREVCERIERLEAAMNRIDRAFWEQFRDPLAEIRAITRGVLAEPPAAGGEGV